MARPLLVGNGDVLVSLDVSGRIRNFYYPHVGQEDHVSGNHHRMGVWIDGKFSWVEKGGWEITLKNLPETMVTDCSAANKALGVELCWSECVHHDQNIYLKKITVRNLSEKKRTIKLYLHQHFHILEANIGDTVFFDPHLNALVDYKGKRYFLISGQTKKGQPFQEYATGETDFQGREGTYVDAYDGKLSQNPIEHGSVDSVLSFGGEFASKEEKEYWYWIAAGKRYGEVKRLHQWVRKETPQKLHHIITHHWKRWVNKRPIPFYDLTPEMIELFKRSVLVIRAQSDNGGAIIAGNDSDVWGDFKRDNYSYMWPRDGALVSRSLDRVGHKTATRRFFTFCANVATDEGYLLHKYRSDGSVGSSWHAWIRNGKPQLPIQEDETALVIDALWKWYEQYQDKVFIKKVYSRFIRQAGMFFVSYRDKKTKLPLETFDLWEEKKGVHTFTCATVYAGLRAAHKFAKQFGTKKDAKLFEDTAEEVRKATVKHLYDQKKGYFIKRLYTDEKGKWQKDYTLDASSGYGIFEYHVLPPTHEKVRKTMEKIVKELSIPPTGGLERYKGDQYFRSKCRGNPWFITTLWLAEYYIACAKTKKDLEKAREIFEWVLKYALPSGTLSEQLDPQTGEQVSISPLTWSHAGYIIAVVKYCDKMRELGE